MLTRLRIRNFKTLDDVDIPLGQNVVLIGPNNSGKTSALQALALWRSGVQEWTARRPEGSSRAKLKTGVALNRKALTHTPVNQARAFWHDLRVTSVSRDNGAQNTQHVFVDVVVDGETGDNPWTCGFEFQHANSESLYCRPVRLNEAMSACPCLQKRSGPPWRCCHRCPAYRPKSPSFSRGAFPSSSAKAKPRKF